MICGIGKEWKIPAKKKKVGMNDSYPCRSGKKNKLCSPNQPKETIYLMKGPEGRGKFIYIRAGG